MKAIDSVKSTVQKEIKNKSFPKGYPAKKTKINKSTTPFKEVGQARRLTLWILVGGAMVIVIVGWLFFLRFQISDNLTKGGGFKEISNGFKNIFQSIDAGIEKIRGINPSELTNSEQLKEAEIKALQKKAFPQFENKNSNR